MADPLDGPNKHMDEEFLETTAASLQKELDSLEAKLTGLDKLKERRDLVRQVLSGIEALKQKQEEDATGKPIWHGAKEILLQRKDPMTAGEITSALQSLGWKFVGKTPSESVKATLMRKSDLFERLSDGRFRLILNPAKTYNGPAYVPPGSPRARKGDKSNS